MVKLNFPEYEIHLLEKDGKLTVFDPARKKYVLLTPEEWVRQHVIRFLVTDRGIPLSLIRVEAEFSLFRTKKRFDIAVCDRNGKGLLVVECKAPGVLLTQNVLDQAVRYNMTLRVNLLMLTNGLQHIYLRMSPEDGIMRQFSELPAYPFSE